MSSCYDRGIGFDNTPATLMLLHIGLATIAGHALAAIHLCLGLLFAWEKTDDLG